MTKPKKAATRVAKAPKPKKVQKNPTLTDKPGHPDASLYTRLVYDVHDKPVRLNTAEIACIAKIPKLKNGETVTLDGVVHECREPMDPREHLPTKPDEVKVIYQDGWYRRWLWLWPQNWEDGTPGAIHVDGSFEHWDNKLFVPGPNGGPTVYEFYENPKKPGEFVEHFEFRTAGQPHRLTGPAVFRQGNWKEMMDEQADIFAFNGINVPEHWTKPGGLNPKNILAESNAEVRRVGMEVYGIDKFVEETVKKVIDGDIESTRNDMRALVLLQDNTKWLIGTDGSTGRVYHMRVPNNIETCAEAYKALTGLDDDSCVGAG
jgi:hypothetical protein